MVGSMFGAAGAGLTGGYRVTGGHWRSREVIIGVVTYFEGFAVFFSGFLAVLSCKVVERLHVAGCCWYGWISRVWVGK